METLKLIIATAVFGYVLWRFNKSTNEVKSLIGEYFDLLEKHERRKNEQENRRL